jgi:hypothetical protein
VCFWLAPEAHFIVVCRQRQGHRSTEVLFQEYIPAMSSWTRVAPITGAPERKPFTTEDTEDHRGRLGGLLFFAR